MEHLGVYFDKALIIQDLFSSDAIVEAERFFEGQDESKAFIQDQSDPSNVIWDKGTGVFQTEFAEKKLRYEEEIEACDLIPCLNGFDKKLATKRHRLGVGGMMDLHNDDPHGLAITTYLSDCDGGELVVLSPHNTSDYIEIKPKRFLTVILKGRTDHYVKEVKVGNRLSLQTFVDFYPKDD